MSEVLSTAPAVFYCYESPCILDEDAAAPAAALVLAVAADPPPPPRPHARPSTRPSARPRIAMTQGHIEGLTQDQIETMGAHVVAMLGPELGDPEIALALADTLVIAARTEQFLAVAQALAVFLQATIKHIGPRLALLDALMGRGTSRGVAS